MKEPCSQCAITPLPGGSGEHPAVAVLTLHIEHARLYEPWPVCASHLEMIATRELLHWYQFVRGDLPAPMPDPMEIIDAKLAEIGRLQERVKRDAMVYRPQSSLPGYAEYTARCAAYEALPEPERQRQFARALKRSAYADDYQRRTGCTTAESWDAARAALPD